MSKAELRAGSLKEFAEVVSGLLREWGTGVVLPWFRGQTNAEWPLVPQFYRMEPTERGRVADWEDEMREEFAMRAPLLLEVRPTNDWDWYVLMRHHGLATRLLDWTEGALLALYFAIRNNEGNCDAGVWALDPWWLNKMVIRRDEVIPVGEPGVSAIDQRRVKRWLSDRFPKKRRPLPKPKHPVAIYPTHFVSRIGTQRSCFTIHGRDPFGLHHVSQRQERLKKIVVSWSCIPSIRKDLEASGIDETTVFPDLDGLGRALNVKWLKERMSSKQPHVGVYTRLRPSRHHGVGVFAVRDIKAGARLFDGDDDEMVWISRSQLMRLPREIMRLYADFAVMRDGKYGCPKTFNRLTVAWYLNESRVPNVRCDEQYDFFAMRKIKRGEELTVDYSSYSDGGNGLNRGRRRLARNRTTRTRKA